MLEFFLSKRTVFLLHIKRIIMLDRQQPFVLNFLYQTHSVTKFNHENRPLDEQRKKLIFIQTDGFIRKFINAMLKMCIFVY